MILERGIKREIEAFDVGFISKRKQLIELGPVRELAHFQLVICVDGGIPAPVEDLLHTRDHLRANATYVVRGDLPDATADDGDGDPYGRHVRVGIEHNLVLRKGVLAGNEELVSRARHLADDLEREVAWPDEARKIVGLI